MKPQAEDHHSIRRAIAAIPGDVSNDAVGINVANIEDIYAPESHSAALDPNTPIVLGHRGTGKSFWARDICAAAFFADAPGPGSAPDGLTHSHFLVRTDAIGSPRRLFENHSQQLCSADSRARRRRVGGLAERGSR
ncbi:hypothetical protein [uncultured Lamprocystis sp.]|uniref:hypothetical protein n=1 Tax=uncultured Lamprocystis sp. TaxID=543132 RepID=UPI0025CC1836|nr:hypothetical protein [uncultured Lamprocystis sp.]